MERNERLIIKESAYCVPFVKWQDTNEDKLWVEKLSKTLKWNKRITQRPLQTKRQRIAKL